jgi:hypothetical protein
MRFGTSVSITFLRNQVTMDIEGLLYFILIVSQEKSHPVPISVGESVWNILNGQ